MARRTIKIKSKIKNYQSSRKIGGSTQGLTQGPIQGSTQGPTPAPTPAPTLGPTPAPTVNEISLSPKLNNIKIQLIQAFNEASPDVLRRKLLEQMEKLSGKKLTMKDQPEYQNKTRKIIPIKEEISNFINELDDRIINADQLLFINEYLKRLMENKFETGRSYEKQNFDNIQFKSLRDTVTKTQQKSSVLFNGYLRRMLARIEKDVGKSIKKEENKFDKTLSQELGIKITSAKSSVDAAKKNKNIIMFYNATEKIVAAAKEMEKIMKEMNKTQGGSQINISHGGADLSQTEIEIQRLTTFIQSQIKTCTDIHAKFLDIYNELKYNTFGMERVRERNMTPEVDELDDALTALTQAKLRFDTLIPLLIKKKKLQQNMPQVSEAKLQQKDESQFKSNDPNGEEQPDTISLLTYNIFSGGCNNFDANIATLPKADLVLTQESSNKIIIHSNKVISGTGTEQVAINTREKIDSDKIKIINKIPSQSQGGAAPRNGIIVTYKNLKIANLHLEGGRFVDQNLLNNFDDLLNYKLALLEDIIAQSPDIIAGDFNSVYHQDKLIKQQYLDSQYKYFKELLKRDLNEAEINNIKTWNESPFDLLVSKNYTYAIPDIKDASYTNARGKTIIDCIWYKRHKLTQKICKIISVMNDRDIYPKNCISDHNPVHGVFDIKPSRRPKPKPKAQAKAQANGEANGEAKGD
jgi:hypothetical protein